MRHDALRDPPWQRRRSARNLPIGLVQGAGEHQRRCLRLRRHRRRCVDARGSHRRAGRHTGRSRSHGARAELRVPRVHARRAVDLLVRGAGAHRWRSGLSMLTGEARLQRRVAAAVLHAGGVAPSGVPLQRELPRRTLPFSRSTDRTSRHAHRRPGGSRWCCRRRGVGRLRGPAGARRPHRLGVGAALVSRDLRAISGNDESQSQELEVAEAVFFPPRPSLNRAWFVQDPRRKQASRATARGKPGQWMGMMDDCPETLTPCGRCQNLMRRHDATCPTCAVATAYRQSR